METEQQKKLKGLVILGKERGYLTLQEVEKVVPESIVGTEHMQGIIAMLNDMGIAVYSEAANDEE